jgi:hypothetical protein
VTAAPASAKALAGARPMPEAAPVTSSTLSLKDQFTNVSFYLMSSMITFTDPGNIQTLPRRNRVRRLRPAPFYATSVVR